VPLAADAYAEISPPMLTCVQKNDGYQFELMVQVARDERAVTKIRIGPYNFRTECRPTPLLGGLMSRGGPENNFWMHRSAPSGWSRIRWEIANDEPESPVYLTWEGRLEPGSMGVFRFISLYRPGGLRAGMIIYRDTEIENLGVNGPNYEKFESHGH
jgi:hypothetical protein